MIWVDSSRIVTLCGPAAAGGDYTITVKESPVRIFELMGAAPP